MLFIAKTIIEYGLFVAIVLLSRGASASPRKRTNRKGRWRLTPGKAFLLSLLLLAGLSLVQEPTPKVHDEFSYLLAADTYAAGRLTNPPHPLWRHFESMHILSQPSYASKYPPGQGLFLAIGVLLGKPVIGIWLSTACAVAAMTWMLEGWFPRRWANLGAWIALLHPTLNLLWGHSFMGGAVATVGAALLFGAYGRYRNGRLSYASALLGAGGLITLANSRPFEGLLVSVPVAVAIAAPWTWSRLRESAGRRMGAIGAALALLIAGGAGMLSYNRAVTGDPLKLPYQVHSRQYMSAPLFLWQKAPEAPEYGNPQLRDFHTGWESANLRLQSTWRDILSMKGRQMFGALHFLASPILIALGIVGVVSRADRCAVPLASLLLMLAGLSTAVWVYPQYLAPGLPLFLLLATHGARRLAAVQGRRGGWGARAVARTTTCYFVLLTIPAASFALFRDQGWHLERQRIARELSELPGDDLVIVQYSQRHDSHAEWVYNRADIDSAAIVWARDLGPQRNAKLLDHFRGRKVWLLQADAAPPQLDEYSKTVARRERGDGEAHTR